MFEKPLKYVQIENFSDLLEYSISLNAISKNTNCFVIKCLPDDIYHPCTIFICEDGKMYLTFENAKEILEKYGYKQIKKYCLDFDVKENPDVKFIKEKYFENRENLSKWQMFDMYKERTGCEECNISLYGLNYKRLNFHPSLELGNPIYVSDEYILRVNKFFTITTIINDLASFEINYDNNILICIDEFGSLQILEFANHEDLLKAVEILKAAKFKEGFSVSFNPTFEKRSKKNDLFRLIKTDKRKIK